VQQHALVSVAHADEARDVAWGKSFDVAQHDNLALTVGQLGQELLHTRCEMLGRDSVVDAVGPGFRRCRPRPGPVEAVLDDAFIGTSRALFAACRGPSSIEQDVEQPGLERGAAFEPFDPADNREPCVLGDFFGYCTTANGRLGEAQHALLVEADERDECGLVSRPKALAQLDVVVHPSRR
jgi:hypothetical protein